MQTSTMEAARAQAYATPLERIDVSDVARFQDDTIWPWFQRLREEDPVHWCAGGPFGPYWSVTKFDDIMAVDTNHEVYSSEAGGISIVNRPDGERLSNFISMDPPRHDAQRKVVTPIVALGHLAHLEPLIRSRVRTILDGLPRGETFNWVERVSIELTTQMLATLFDFPFEERRKLTYWSDVATTLPKPGTPIDSWAKRDEILRECAQYFTRLWNERVNAEPRNDLISMLAHAPATRDMSPREFLGNLVLLIVGGNDTTRNSISGGLLFMNRNPGEYRKLRENPALIPSAVSEIIRYQTPLAHMRRTALRDAELGGKTIRAGDKVVMWYVSGNRDGTVIDDPDRFVIDRARPRQHLSFGFGIHRCVGNRLAELQLKILWEELLPRYPVVEVVGEPVRVLSNFVHGFAELPVRIPS